MMKDIEKYKETIRALGRPLEHLGKNHRKYVEDLARTANVKCIPPVLNKMFDYVYPERFQIFTLAYRIISDEEFECYECAC